MQIGKYRGRNKKAVLIIIFSNQYFWGYITTEISSQSVEIVYFSVVYIWIS